MSWAKKWQNFNPSSTNLTRKPLFFLARDYCENNNSSSKQGKGGTVKLRSFFAATQVFYYEKHRRTIGILRLSEGKRGD